MRGGMHLVILGAGASIASCIRNPETLGQELPSMRDIGKTIFINDLLVNIPNELYSDNFEELYSNIYEWNSQTPILPIINQRIYDYFKNLYLPQTPTIYDYLIMSLRDRDVIATFNWDPFLYQAWWRNGLHGSNPNLLFLHGNVAVGYNEEIKGIGWANSLGKRHNVFYEATPLLFPTKVKDYQSNTFIKEQWAALKWALSNANRVTIFGYSAPISDTAAQKLMSEAWGPSSKRSMEQFEIIDVKPEDEVKKSWSPFIHSHHYDYCTNFFDSSLALYPRRTFEAYMCQYLPITPEDAFVESNLIPHDNIHSFEELWEWYNELIIKENELRN